MSRPPECRARGTKARPGWARLGWAGHLCVRLSAHSLQCRNAHAHGRCETAAGWRKKESVRNEETWGGEGRRAGFLLCDVRQTFTFLAFGNHANNGE